ncbi:FlgT C-terminal domain-containing protein [Micromonospora profundi]|uniref:FlgT C-terminal domain-containing protein n=1 Tax=Micromonospora profundi TaxID=1420889 RepID=UPI0033A8D565
MSEIEAKVARVISDHQLAINAGGSQGVREGDAVALYRTVDVKDPDSGDILGSVKVKHLSLEVAFVEPKFCVATVIERQPSDRPNAIFIQSMMPLKRITSTPVRQRSTGEVYVAVGDIVIISQSD